MYVCLPVRLSNNQFGCFLAFWRGSLGVPGAVGVPGRVEVVDWQTRSVCGNFHMDRGNDGGDMSRTKV